MAGKLNTPSHELASPMSQGGSKSPSKNSVPVAERLKLSCYMTITQRVSRPEISVKALKHAVCTQVGVHWFQGAIIHDHLLRLEAWHAVCILHQQDVICSCSSYTRMTAFIKSLLVLCFICSL